MISRFLSAAAAVLLATAPLSAGVGALKVFPNPARTNIGHTEIRFTNITNGGEIKIFNSSGRLVLERSIDPGLTEFVWNLRNNDQRDVASGIYVYFITSEGEERTGKVGVIR